MPNSIRSQRILVGLLIAAPGLLFLVLRLFPALDASADNHIFHFYIVSFASLVSLVVALFVSSGTGIRSPQTLFVEIAFASIAGLFLIHAITTPGVFLPNGNPGIALSGRLSLFVGAIFLFMATLEWQPDQEIWITRNARILWLGLSILYVAYLAFVFGIPEFAALLERSSFLTTLLAIFTIGLLVWGTWRIWQSHLDKSGRLALALALALPWLALAQLSQYSAPLWATSWWLYHAFMLSAFVVTMASLMMDYEEVLSFNVTRYFTAISIIVGVPVVAILSEVTVQVSGNPSSRWLMFAFGFLALFLLFLILLLVVRHAEAIVRERNSALEAEKQWRTDLTNLIIHDLKSPLSVISISLSLVLSGRLEDVAEAQRLPLERAARGSHEMAEMIDNLLDVERFEAGLLRLTLTSGALATFLIQTVESVLGVAQAYDLKVETSIPDNLPVLQIDQALIRRVLQNLLANAIKFTAQGGKIRIEATSSGETVCISVEDTGPGIPPGQRARIFDKFTQGEGTVRHGAGLGLTFCKLAVEAHGGHIWMEDGTGGIGSRFTFNLPVKLV